MLNREQIIDNLANEADAVSAMLSQGFVLNVSGGMTAWPPCTPSPLQQDDHAGRYEELT